MTTAVIGGTGRVGSEIVRGLIARGDAVALLVRDPDEARRVFGEPDRLRIRPTRLDDPRDLAEAFDGIRTVFIRDGIHSRAPRGLYLILFVSAPCRQGAPHAEEKGKGRACPACAPWATGMPSDKMRPKEESMLAGTRFSGVLAVAFLAAACGGDDTLTREQAAQAFTSMQSAVTEVSTQAEVSASQHGGTVSVTAACSAGGHASASGQWVTDQSFSLDVTFTSCAVGNITINGDLSYAATESSTSATLTMEGHLSFSGAVTGSCGVDLTAALSSSTLHLSGNICGIELDENLGP